MEMPAETVVAVMACLSSAVIDAWLDGGWGVDALLSHQTRPHDDLDLVVSIDDTDRILAALAPLGFTMDADERPVRYTLRAGPLQVDLHPVTWDAEGGGLQAQPGERPPFRYTPEGLAGTGTVACVTLPCLTAAFQLRVHQGYAPDATDRHDVLALCQRFGLEAPEGYR